MNIEDQVVSLELAKKLQELGVKQESHFFFHCAGNRCSIGESRQVMEGQHPEIVLFNKNNNTYSAFTVAELGEMLPKGYRSGKAGNPKKGDYKVYVNVCYSSHRDGYSHTTSEDTEANARAKMLIYLLENNLITA